jgi:hypothetical protein
MHRKKCTLIHSFVYSWKGVGTNKKCTLKIQGLLWLHIKDIYFDLTQTKICSWHP